MLRKKKKKKEDKATPFSVCNGAAKTEERCEKAGTTVKGRNRLEVARGYKLLDLLSASLGKSRSTDIGRPCDRAACVGGF